jgi:hypothetical protein
MVNFDINNLSSYSLVTPFKVNITAWRNVGQYIEAILMSSYCKTANFRRVTCTIPDKAIRLNESNTSLSNLIEVGCWSQMR